MCQKMHSWYSTTPLSPVPVLISTIFGLYYQFCEYSATKEQKKSKIVAKWEIRERPSGSSKNLKKMFGNMLQYLKWAKLQDKRGHKRKFLRGDFCGDFLFHMMLRFFFPHPELNLFSFRPPFYVSCFSRPEGDRKAIKVINHEKS